MQITIITVGNIKEKYLKEACKDYLKRISRFAKVKEIELKDESNTLPESVVLKKEAQKILQNLKDDNYIIVMDIDGEQMSSEKMATMVEKLQVNGRSNITFIIGGSYGIAQEIKDKANFRLSFSKMTFPHQLFKVILLEQIYRSFKIINNQNYHK